MNESLANRYRPHKFDQVCSQESVIRILQNQIDTKTFKQAYIFTGPAGCGKTTCARILANEMNNGVGEPIEIDAASNNSVDNIRQISDQARMQSLDSEYKVYILDEVHMLSGGAWAAMLKLIEEPPAKTIFILCTTDVQKVPNTILSRCQRFDFSRISEQIIAERLLYVMEQEHIRQSVSVAHYIASLSNGGMRTALSLLDKVLSYNCELTIENTVDALGTVSHDTMFDMLTHIVNCQDAYVISEIESEYQAGKDLKQFVKSFMLFVLDVRKYQLTGTLKYTDIPEIYSEKMFAYAGRCEDSVQIVLEALVKLNADIKYESNPRALIEASLISIKLGD